MDYLAHFLLWLQNLKERPKALTDEVQAILSPLTRKETIICLAMMKLTREGKTPFDIKRIQFACIRPLQFKTLRDIKHKGILRQVSQTPGWRTAPIQWELTLEGTRKMIEIQKQLARVVNSYNESIQPPAP